MSGLPGARNGDPALCAHSVFGIDASSTREVNVNGAQAAKATDPSGCKGKFIVTGSGTVNINGLPAARIDDLTSDGGVVGGSKDVFIGGPRAGATLGRTDLCTRACEAAAVSRHNPGKSQSFGNCGLEAWRQVINLRRAARGENPMTEDDLIKLGTDHGLAGNDPAKPWAYGATSADGRKTLLARPEVKLETHEVASDPATLQSLVGDGYPVSVSVHPYYYWPDRPGAPRAGAKPEWNHEVLVTGVTYDANGKVVGYVINDSGLGECGYPVPADKFETSFIQGNPFTVGNDKL